MNILEELNAAIDVLDIPVETGVFSKPPPETYVVLTPLNDDYGLFADNCPQVDIQHVRISLFCQGNYLSKKNKLVTSLLDAEFTVTERRFIGREDDSGYYHYSIDVEKEYTNSEEDLTWQQ